MLLGHHWLFEDWFFFNQFCFRPSKLLWVSHDFCFQNSLNGKIYWKDIGWISRPIIGTNEVSLLHPILKPFKCLACARDWRKIHPISSRKVFLRKNLEHILQNLVLVILLIFEARFYKKQRLFCLSFVIPSPYHLNDPIAK